MTDQTVTLSLTKDEASRLAAALHVCTMSGGGSQNFTLLRKVFAQAEIDFGSDAYNALLPIMADACIDEAVEAGVVVRA